MNMAKCKNKDCEKEAMEGSDYCPSCVAKRDHRKKNIFRIIVTGCVAIAAVVAPFFSKGKSET